MKILIKLPIVYNRYKFDYEAMYKDTALMDSLNKANQDKMRNLKKIYYIYN